MTKQKKASSKKGKKKKDSQNKASSEGVTERAEENALNVEMTLEDQKNSLSTQTKEDVQIIPNENIADFHFDDGADGSIFTGSSMRLFAGYSSQIGSTFNSFHDGDDRYHPLLTLAKARLLVLWVALIPRGITGELGLIQLALAINPLEITEQMHELALALNEEEMLSFDDLTEVQFWKVCDQNNTSPENLLNKIEWMRRRTKPATKTRTIKSKTPKNIELQPLSHYSHQLDDEEDEDDIYNFSHLESKYESRDFGHSTGIVSTKPLLSSHDDDDESPLLSKQPHTFNAHAGPERALSVFLQVQATDALWEKGDRHNGSAEMILSKSAHDEIREEMKYFLSVPERCLLFCYLTERDKRSPNVIRPDLTDALRLVERWSSSILELLSDLTVKQQQIVKDCIKKSYYRLIKLSESEPDKVVQSMRNLRMSSLVQLTPVEIAALEKEEMVFRWADTKMKGDAMYGEGQYSACKGLFQKAIPEYNLFEKYQEYASIMVKKCEHKVKQELKPNGSSRSKTVVDPHARSPFNKQKDEVASNKKEKLPKEGNDLYQDILMYVDTLSDSELRQVLSLDGTHQKVIVEALRLLETMTDVSSTFEKLHDNLVGNNMAVDQSPPRPSDAISLFTDKFRNTWPCHNNIANYFPKYSKETRHSFSICECNTCRGTDGELHLVCECCAAIHHGESTSHRVKPLGQAQECDDAKKTSPWSPLLFIRRMKDIHEEEETPSTATMMLESIVKSTEEGDLMIGLELPAEKERKYYVEDLFKKANYVKDLKVSVEGTKKRGGRYYNLTHAIKKWDDSINNIDFNISRTERTAKIAAQVYEVKYKDDFDNDIEDDESSSKQMEANLMVHSTHKWATGNASSIDRRDDGDCLESGDYRQKLEVKQMEHMYADLKSYKKQKFETQLTMALEMNEMTINFWIVRVLYEHYILSSIACLLKAQLTKFCLKAKEDAIAHLEQQRLEDANKAAKALQEEEEKVLKQFEKSSSAKKAASNKKQQKDKKDKSRSRGQKEANREAAQKAEELRKKQEREEAEEKARLKRREQFLAEQSALREAREAILAIKEKEMMEQKMMENEREIREALKLSENEANVSTMPYGQEEVVTQEPVVEKVTHESSPKELIGDMVSSELVPTVNENDSLPPSSQNDKETVQNSLTNGKTKKKKTKKQQKKEKSQEQPPQPTEPPTEQPSQPSTEQPSQPPTEPPTEHSPQPLTKQPRHPQPEEQSEPPQNCEQQAEIPPEAQTQQKDEGDAEEEVQNEGAYQANYFENRGGGGGQYHPQMQYPQQTSPQPMMMPPMYGGPPIPMMMPNMMQPMMMPQYFVPPPNAAAAVDGNIQQQHSPYMPYPMMPVFGMQPHAMMEQPYYYDTTGEDPVHRSLWVPQNAQHPPKQNSSKKYKKPMVVSNELIESLLSRNVADWVTREHAEILLGWCRNRVEEAVDQIRNDESGELKNALDSQISLSQFKIKNLLGGLKSKK